MPQEECHSLPSVPAREPVHPGAGERHTVVVDLFSCETLAGAVAGGDYRHRQREARPWQLT